MMVPVVSVVRRDFSEEENLNENIKGVRRSCL